MPGGVSLFFPRNTGPEVCVYTYARTLRKYILGKNEGSVEKWRKRTLASFNCNFHDARIPMKISTRYGCAGRARK